MTTPYCTAVRLRRRAVDALRQAIADCTERMTLLERRAAELRKTVDTERRLAANYGVLPENLYFRRMRLEHDRLVAERTAASAELESLRGRAQETFASLRAMEDAADRFRSDRERSAASAEQAAADDRAAAAFLLQRKRA